MPLQTAEDASAELLDYGGPRWPVSTYFEPVGITAARCSEACPVKRLTHGGRCGRVLVARVVNGRQRLRGRAEQARLSRSYF